VWIGLVALVAMATRSTRGPGASAPSSGGRVMTLAELRALALQAGFPAEQLDVAAAIAMAESGGNPAAIGDQGTSFGLWQIHVPSHPEYDSTQLLAAEYNARAALAISRQGSDWTPWSTYKPGPHGEPAAYLRFLGGGTA